MPDPVLRDTFSASKAWLRALEATGRIEHEPHRTLPIVIDELAAKFGEAPALLSDRGTFSFKDLAARVNAVARWVFGAKSRQATTVGLLMPTSRIIWQSGLASRASGAASRSSTRNCAAPHWRIASALPNRGVSSFQPRCAKVSTLHSATRNSRPKFGFTKRHLDAALTSFATTPLQGQELPDRACRTVRSAFTPPAQRACRRPPTSAIAAS